MKIIELVKLPAMNFQTRNGETFEVPENLASALVGSIQGRLDFSIFSPHPCKVSIRSASAKAPMYEKPRIAR